MIQLDAPLLFEAQRLINGADAHRVKQMIFAYEQSVDLHNRNWPGHEVYRAAHELRLRRYVLDRRFEALRQWSVDAHECARRGFACSAAVIRNYDRLEEALESMQFDNNISEREKPEYR